MKKAKGLKNCNMKERPTFIASGCTREINALSSAEKVLAKHRILTAEISQQIRDVVRGLLENRGTDRQSLEDSLVNQKTKEAQVLRILLENRGNGQYVSQQDFLRKIYGTDKLTPRNSRKLRVLIFRVRRRIGEAGIIVFERERGYALYDSETNAGK